MRTTITIIIIIIVIALAWWAFMSYSNQPATSANTLYSTSTALAPSTSTDITVPGAGIQSQFFNVTSSSALGTFLTDANGRTLYVFTNDTSGTSSCAGTCATIWPPYGPGSNSSGTATLPVNIGLITRTNGSSQFTWDGLPLYYYSKDTTPGDTLGQGVGNTWYVVAVQ